MNHLNNPLNIRRVATQRWLGSVPGTGPFEEFEDPRWCYRAAHRIVLRHWGTGPKVADLIEHWAPPNENATAVYVKNVCGWMAQDPDTPLTTQQIPFLFHAMTRQEQGAYPYPNDNPIYEGIELDGGGADVAIPMPAPVDSAPETPPEPPEDPPVPAAPAPTPPPVDAPNPFLPSQSTTSSLGLGAAASVLLVWVLDQFHLHMDPEQAMAAGVVISTLAGYFAKGGRAIHTQGTQP